MFKGFCLQINKFEKVTAFYFLTIYSLRNVLVFINHQKVYSKYFESFCCKGLFSLSGLISKASIFQLRVFSLEKLFGLYFFRNSSRCNLSTDWNLLFPYIAHILYVNLDVFFCDCIPIT